MYKVLVADDARVMRFATLRILKKLGLAAVEAEDGLQALDLFESEKPDLVLIDVQMPGLDGLEVVRRIRQQVGHFLYIADRARREIIVFNSNRMTVIDRIQVPDPTSLAMGTNLDVLAADMHILDPAFADLLTRAMGDMLDGTWRKGGYRDLPGVVA